MGKSQIIQNGCSKLKIEIPRLLNTTNLSKEQLISIIVELAVEDFSNTKIDNWHWGVEDQLKQLKQIIETQQVKED